MRKINWRQFLEDMLIGTLSTGIFLAWFMGSALYKANQDLALSISLTACFFVVVGVGYACFEQRKALKVLFSTPKFKRIWTGACIGIIIVSVIMGALMPYFANATVKSEETRIMGIPYTTVYEGNSDLEVGQTRIISPGVNGEKQVTYEITKKLLGGKTVSEKKINEKVLTEMKEAVIQRGTRKWQYMYCSDGTYKYYTDEQFAQPNVGFTSASEDTCAKDGHGVKTQLGDEPPPQRQQAYYYQAPAGGGAICRDGTRSYSTGRGTCSHHGGVSYWL